MMLNAALPSATSFEASCQVSDALSEFVYDSNSRYRFSAVLTPGLFQFAPFFQSDAQPFVPIVAIITVSSRCFCVHCSPTASGIRFAAFAFFSAAMKPLHDFGAPEMPALRSAAGLYQRTFARWMFTGTEYKCPLYVIC